MVNGLTVRTLIMGVLVYFITPSLFAETQPKFDIIPTTSTTWFLPSNGFATVGYCVTNRTDITRTLTVGPVSGIVQQLGVSGVAPCATPCDNPFTLAHNQSCFLTLQLDGSQLQGEVVGGPVICKTNGPSDNTPDPFLCSQPSAFNSLHIFGIGYEQALLTVSPTFLSLTENPNSLPPPCGEPGVLTVTNHSKAVTAQAIHMTPVTGASVTSSGCSSLAPGASTCTFTITPGTTNEPPQTVTIQGSNTTATSATVHIAEGIAPISVSPPLLILNIGGAGQNLTITNESACISAKSVTGYLDFFLTLAGVTQTPNPCSPTIDPLGTCVLTVTPGLNFVQSGLDQFYGDNTTVSDVEISVWPLSDAFLEITDVNPSNTPSQTLLLTPNGSPGTITVKNISPTVTAINVGSSGLPADVTQISSNCATIAPEHSCTLTYLPGSTVVPTSYFLIGSSNTWPAIASVSVSYPQLTISQAELLLARDGSFTAASGCNSSPASDCTVGPSKARVLTISNNTPFTATNVTYTISPPLPTLTTISPSGCGNITQTTPCVLTITPGANPSAPAPGVAPPSVLTASGINTNTVTSNIKVLTYGNNFLSGYIFSMDDSTPQTQSIGGKVSSLNNVGGNAGLPWDSTKNCEGGSCVTTDATHLYNGAVNTTNILSAMTAAGALPLSYAAGQCVDYTSGGFNNWYLPAECELGYLPNSGTCTNSADTANPEIQNIYNVTAAFPTTYPNNAYYWSSTEVGGDNTPLAAALNLISLAYQTPPKSSSYPVLCVHTF